MAPAMNARNRRLTLKDINQLMPEENSSLESEEDKEQYFEKLMQQDKHIKFTQHVKEQYEKGNFREQIGKLDEFPDLNEVITEGPVEPNPHQKIEQANIASPNDMLDEILEFEENKEFKEENKKSEVQEIKQHPINHTSEYDDLMQKLDSNERKYQDDAKSLLKKNSILGKAAQQAKQQIRTRIVSNFQNLNSVTSKLMKEHQLTQARSTCVGISESLVMIGNSEGQLQLFDRDNEQYYATFTEKSKEFVGNAVTAIDVHPLRPEYVILGFANGQLVLMDVVKSPNKSLKVVKDSSRNVPIINARFADWAGPQGRLYNMVKQKFGSSKDSNKKDDVPQQDENQQNFMIVSIDADGYVYITTMIKIMIVYKVSRYLVVDPMKSNYDQFSSMAARFQSPIHGQGLYDTLALVGIANRDTLVIFEAKQNDHKVFGSIKKPQKFYNRANGNFDPFLPLCVPALSWGYGMSPVLKDQPHSMLAIGWGPVIQIAVLIDNQQLEKPIILDGFHIIRCFDLEAMSLPRDMFISGEINAQNENLEEGVQEPLNQPDEFEAFRQQDACYIEALFFLSDSTLLVLLSGQEMRILDTQNFRPEAYDPERIISQKQQQSRLSVKRESMQIQGQNKTTLSADELEIGIRCARVLKSECGQYSSNFPMYQQTLKYFGGKFVGMTTKGIQSCSHLTWQQSIYDFQKTQVRNSQAIIGGNARTSLNEEQEEEHDLTQVFLRALELYKGRIKGYQGLIDNAYLRENFLRAELKLFVKEIIQQIVEDASKSVSSIQSQLKQEGIKIIDEQIDKDRNNKFRKIVRLAIEFCVELRDCDFLFKDLCWLFQDFGGKDFEYLFIKELEVFILAGKFSEWQLPSEVVENYIARYYLSPNMDFSQDPAIFEKVIVNLNLSQCSKDQILQYVKYSEQHSLTTGIIFLYTQLFDRKENASCVQVLFSLYDLYRRAADQEETSETNLEALRQVVQQLSLEETMTHQKSKVYLGYRLFWLINLFMHGKKYPHGSIKETKWRSYVHDIVQFMSNPEILKDLASIDAITLFDIITVIFNPNSRLYELILLGRDDFQQNNFNTRFQTHLDFLNDMDMCFAQDSGAPEKGVHQYVIFVATLVCQNRELSSNLKPNFFYNAVKQILKYHQVYLNHNRDGKDVKTNNPALDTNQLLNRVSILNEPLFYQYESDEIMRSAEEARYVWKSESEIINMLRKCEPLSSEQVSELLEQTEKIKLFEQIQLYLLEKKEDFIRCLQMLINEAERNWSALPQIGEIGRGTTVTDHSELPIVAQLILMSVTEAQEKKGEKTLKWLSEKLRYLETTQNEKKLIQLKEETLHHLMKLLKMSRNEFVKLIEDRFQGNHQQVMGMLRKKPTEQFLYLETLLETQSEKINEAIRTFSVGGGNQQAKNYLEFMKLRLKLCCQINPERVFSLVEKMVHSKRDIMFPIEECLEICKEHKQMEACFLLNKKLGKYFEAVTQGIQIVQRKLSVDKMKVELYFAKKNNIDISYPLTNTQLGECYFFDAIFRRIFQILSKHGKEVEVDKEEKVWYLVVDALLDLKSGSQVAHKAYCRIFFQQRLNLLVEAMSRTLSFNKFLDHATSRYQDTQFKEFQEIILHVVQTQNSEENVLANANNANFKVNTLLFENFALSVKFGMPLRSQVCFICRKHLNKKDQIDEEIDERELDEEIQDDDQDPLNDDKVKVFACKHTFHFQCLRRHQKKKYPQSDLSEMYLRVGCNQLKCPICNITNFDLETPFSQQPSRQLNNRRNNMQFQEIPEDEDLFEYRKRELKKQELRMTKRENNAQNQILKNLDSLRRRMDIFQGQSASEVLTLTDFNKIKNVSKASIDTPKIIKQEIQMTEQAAVQQQGLEMEQKIQQEEPIVQSKKPVKTAKGVASLFKR